MKLLSIYIAGFQSINRAAYVEFADGAYYREGDR